LKQAAAISVVVPVWNDAEALECCLKATCGLRGLFEIVVADASEDYACREIAERFGVKYVRCTQPNRGSQMNAGAAAASGELLLFHHADTELSREHVTSLLSIVTEPQIVGGAFYREFDARHPRLRWLEFFGRKLNDWGGTLFGDQSIFVRREHFEKLGGFAAIPLMEDIEFSRRLRRSGKTVLLDPPIHSSSRRFSRGSWRTTLENGALILLFKCGVAPHRLHAWYYRTRRATEPAAAAIYS
jgi:rSAM/selenodomain-associated transferase 2